MTLFCVWSPLWCCRGSVCGHLYGIVEGLAVQALVVGSDVQHVHLTPGHHDPDQSLVVCTRTLTE